MTSNTTAFYSSQSEVSQIITAGIWEVPEVFINGCGEEYTIDEVTGEKILVDHESKDGNPIEERGNEIDCVAKEDTPEKTDEKDPTAELVCAGKDGTLVEENEKSSASREEVKDDCLNKDGEPNKEIEKENAPEDIVTNEPITEKENANKPVVVDSKEDKPLSDDESEKQPDSKNAPVIESKEENTNEKDSAKDVPSEKSSDKKDDEINDVVK